MNEVVVYRSAELPAQLQVWGWEIPVYLFLGGLTAGLLILSALLTRRAQLEHSSRWVRWAPFAAPVIISVGMAVLFLDLSHKPMVYNFYRTFQLSSPMSWGSWLLLAVYPASLALGLAQLRPEELAWLTAWRPVRVLRLASLTGWLAAGSARQRTRLLALNLVLGVGLGIYTGILLEGLGIAHPLWNSLALGPLFLVSGLSTGAALLMLFPLQHEEHDQLRRWDLWAIGLELTLLLALLGGLIAGGGALGRRAAGLFLGGAFTASFWSLVIVAGLVAPFLFEVIEGRKRLAASALAPALLLIGGFSLRWILVLAGQV